MEEEVFDITKYTKDMILVGVIKVPSFCCGHFDPQFRVQRKDRVDRLLGECYDLKLLESYFSGKDVEMPFIIRQCSHCGQKFKETADKFYKIIEE